MARSNHVVHVVLSDRQDEFLKRMAEADPFMTRSRVMRDALDAFMARRGAVVVAGSEPEGL